jgi:hypothetical protein
MKYTLALIAIAAAMLVNASAQESVSKIGNTIFYQASPTAQTESFISMKSATGTTYYRTSPEPVDQTPMAPVQPTQPTQPTMIRSRFGQ